jgi:ABC-type nitrate/sulfonate/bicarbonate transport system ATPase subunit
MTIPVYAREERLLTVDKLSIAYGPKIILRDINLRVDNLTRPGMSQGQCVALLGPSGIGKTQLFRAIAGLQHPTEGTVTLSDGKPVIAGQIGVVQQAYPLLNHRTILSNLQLAARKHADGVAELERYLDYFGLADKKSSYPLELSGGQRQRIAIIQQLLCSNHILLMDEPFSGLDPIAKGKVYDTITKVTTEHELNTVIFTTHDIGSAVRLADEVWVLGREAGKAGATVVKRIDLIGAGLAWDSDINHNPRFWPMVNDLHDLFKTL